VEMIGVVMVVAPLCFFAFLQEKLKLGMRLEKPKNTWAFVQVQNISTLEKKTSKTLIFKKSTDDLTKKSLAFSHLL
jgi:hypothetical protein